VIDSHTHLELCEPPTAELVEAALEVGVTRIVTVGIDSQSCQAALAAAEQFAPVYAAIGRHPNSATGFSSEDLAEIRALAGHEKCVAIGETGLDYYRDHAPHEDQQRAFAAQIELAAELDKPVVIHTRAAEADTLAMLGGLDAGLRVILHCFSMPQQLDECLSHEDWWFSFAGNATYPKAVELRQAARLVPEERLLVETDAPFLAPQALRGKPNQPAYVARTAEVLAEVRGASYDELDAAVQRNAEAVFRW
jgi:TatD DNase family protein